MKKKTSGEERRRRRRYREVIMYRDYLYSIDLLGRIVNTRDERRCALSTDLRRADGTSKAHPGASPFKPATQAGIKKKKKKKKNLWTQAHKTDTYKTI